MEIRIGVQHAPRDVVLESTATPEQVRGQVDAALADGSALTLTDDKGSANVTLAAAMTNAQVIAALTAALGTLGLHFMGRL